MAFVSTSIFQKALTLAQSEGLSLHKLQLHVNRLASIEGKKYLPMDWLLDLYEQAGEELPSGFGLRQGLQLNADDYGTLGLSWKTCWTAREVLARTERFMVLVTDKGSAKITENNKTVCVHLYRDTTRPGLSTANEATFVMLTGILEEVTGTSIMPVGVSFQHRLEDKTQFVSYFRGPVFDNQKGNFIKFNLIDVKRTNYKKLTEVFRRFCWREWKKKETLFRSITTVYSMKCRYSSRKLCPVEFPVLFNWRNTWE